MLMLIPLIPLGHVVDLENGISGILYPMCGYILSLVLCVASIVPDDLKAPDGNIRLLLFSYLAVTAPFIGGPIAISYASTFQRPSFQLIDPETTSSDNFLTLLTNGDSNNFPRNCIFSQDSETNSKLSACNLKMVTEPPEERGSLRGSPNCTTEITIYVRCARIAVRLDKIELKETAPFCSANPCVKPLSRKTGPSLGALSFILIAVLGTLAARRVKRAPELDSLLRVPSDPDENLPSQPESINA